MGWEGEKREVGGRVGWVGGRGRVVLTIFERTDRCGCMIFSFFLLVRDVFEVGKGKERERESKREGGEDASRA